VLDEIESYLGRLVG